MTFTVAQEIQEGDELEQARAARSQRVDALGLKDAPHPENATVFLFAGEGVHSTDTDISALKISPAWSEVEAALQVVTGAKLETFLLEGTRQLPVAYSDAAHLHALSAKTVFQMAQGWGTTDLRPLL